jgi:hypothetical protein
MDRTGRCAERHNATTTGPARVIRELLVEVNGTDKPRDSFIYSYEYRRKSPAQAGLSCFLPRWLIRRGSLGAARVALDDLPFAVALHPYICKHEFTGNVA